MIGKIAWKNIWRNKVRSAVVIIAIAIGLWAGMFASAFVVGMMNQKIDSVINLELSHFQVHHPSFQDEMLPKFVIPNSEEIIQKMNNNEAIKNTSPRVVAMPMINSANYSGMLKVTGIDPENEKRVTDLHEFVLEGKYFEGIKRNPILLSKKTAEKYKIKIRSKVVLTLQDKQGEITAGAFRVVGIYDSKNGMYDEMNAFVLAPDLQKLLDINHDVHEIAVLLNEHDLAESVATQYQEEFPNLEIKSWMDLESGMRFMVEAMDVYTFFIVGIILVALLFSIINTMLMAVLERVREIGMLMAVGMSKLRVFKMIMLETVFLCLIGGPLGLLLAWICIQYFGRYGIDLGGASYSDYGFTNLVYTQLDMMSYISVTLMVLGMAILAAIYPAVKAINLIPVEAIRKI